MSFLLAVLFVLAVSCFLCLFRIADGPTAPDRTVAIDILGILVVGVCVVAAVATGRDFYINIGIAWSLLSFIGTLALAKHLEGRTFHD